MIAVGLVTAALLFINDSGIAALQEVVIIIAFPFFITYFVMMCSLVKAMNDDSAAARRYRSRQWEKTDTAEKLEEGENKPAPGYDSEGNAVDRPEFEYDAEEGTWRLEESLILGEDVQVSGDGQSKAGSKVNWVEQEDPK